MKLLLRQAIGSKRAIARCTLGAVLLACGAVREPSGTSDNAGGSDASSGPPISDSGTDASLVDGALGREASALPEPTQSFLFSFDGQVVALQGALRVEVIAMGSKEVAMRMSGFLEGPSIPSTGIPAAFSVTVAPRASGAGACGSDVTVSLEIPSINQPTRYGTIFAGAYCEKRIDSMIATGFSIGTASGKLITGDNTAAAGFSVSWAQKVPPP